MIPKPEEIDMVLYHAGCRDGFGAAYAAWKRVGDRATYHAVKYGQKDIPDVTLRNVAIVDFSFPRPVLEDMAARAKSLIVLDHHRTAQADLEGLPYAIFDMERSGAGMAWDFFHGTNGFRGGRPFLIDMIEDGDLWRWFYPKSKPFLTALSMEPFEFPVYDKYVEDPSLINDAVTRGEAILAYTEAQVKKQCAHAVERRLGGFKAHVINIPIWQSDVGHVLAEKGDVGVSWFYDHEQKLTIVSLRSDRDDVDVGALAKQFGGGGHARAAGFTTTKHIEDIFE